MKKILVQIIEKWICKHEWETFQKSTVYSECNDVIPIRFEFILICKKCGKIKKIKL